MKDRWKYLDKMNYNLLYSYADVLSGKRRQIHMGSHSDREETCTEALIKAEQRRYNIYYLIWFAYRYLLGCEKYEDTLPYQNEETLSKYRLLSYIRKGHIFIDYDGDVFFRKPEDIGMILEILYGRYDYFAQMECFIAHTTKNRRNHAQMVLDENTERLKQLHMYPFEEVKK